MFIYAYRARGKCAALNVRKFYPASLFTFLVVCYIIDVEDPDLPGRQRGKQKQMFTFWSVIRL